MILRPKHLALSLVLFIFVSIIFAINYSWGNSLWTCFVLSFYTFIMIFMAFNIYWEMRDFWQFRWYRADLQAIQKERFEIPLGEAKGLVAEVIHHPNTAPTAPLIIFSYGFSDDRYSTQYLTVPLAIAGYDVLIYDTRGKNESRKVGRKNEFLEIVNDLGQIIRFVKEHPKYQAHPIYLVGISLGAIGSLVQGIWSQDVSKIISVAAMSNYRDNFPRSNIPFIGSWWFWLRFKLFGVMFNPSDEINAQLSPAIQIAKYKQQFPPGTPEWRALVQKVYLIHAADDILIEAKNFLALQSILESPEDHWVVIKNGGHMFRKSEMQLTATIINMLNDKRGD